MGIGYGPQVTSPYTAGLWHTEVIGREAAGIVGRPDSDRPASALASLGSRFTKLHTSRIRHFVGVGTIPWNANFWARLPSLSSAV